MSEPAPKHRRDISRQVRKIRELRERDSKWSRQYWTDLGERTAATLLGALLTMLTASSSGVVSGDPRQWWLLVGLPTVLALLKGLLANLAAPASGPSLVPSPPAPDMDS